MVYEWLALRAMLLREDCLGKRKNSVHLLDNIEKVRKSMRCSMCCSCLIRCAVRLMTQIVRVYFKRSPTNPRETPSTPVPLKCTHTISQRIMHSVSYHASASPHVHSQDTVSNATLGMISTGGAVLYPDPI